MKTIQEAQDYIIANREKGAACPCCGRFCKLYPRKLHSEMAIFLIKLVRQHKLTSDWVHVRRIVITTTKASTDGIYLIHWDLIVRKSGSSGLYKPTEKGIDFAMRLVRVPRQVFVFRNQPVGFSSDDVDIVEALGDKFDYQQLMSGKVP